MSGPAGMVRRSRGPRTTRGGSELARIGNVTAPGRYTLGAWKEQTAKYTQQQLERQVISTDRITVVRCSYPAGSDFCLHFHPQEQITIVESGTLVFEIELLAVNEAAAAGAGDAGSGKKKDK